MFMFIIEIQRKLYSSFEYLTMHLIITTHNGSIRLAKKETGKTKRMKNWTEIITRMKLIYPHNSQMKKFFRILLFTSPRGDARRLTGIINEQGTKRRKHYDNSSFDKWFKSGCIQNSQKRQNNKKMIIFTVEFSGLSQLSPILICILADHGDTKKYAKTIPWK